MKLIVGLGNPGKEYVNTRHNIGFQFLDSIALKYGVTFSKKKFNGMYTEFMLNDEKIILLKPLSYMNLSGTVISKYMNYFKIDLKDVLIIHDDLDMNFGRIKIVFNSSSGGHNGIKDIERCLGSKEYARVKIGISNDKSIDTKDYVLGSLTSEELNILNDIYKNLENIIIDFCNDSLSKLMSKYNHKV